MKKNLEKFNQDEVLLSNKHLQAIKGGGDPEDEPEKSKQKSSASLLLS